MTGMENVLAAHSGHAFGREEADETRWFDKCECGHMLFGIDYSPEHKMRPGKSYANAAFAAHVAEALTAAGFGNLYDAWEEGAEALTDHWANEQYSPHSNGNSDPPANPYPAPKVSES